MLARTRVPVGHPWALGVKGDKRADLFNKKRIAIFQTKDGKYHGLDDECSHRGARLSQGKVIDDCLQCPYHGWTFDKDGNLSHVPTGPNPKKANIMSYDLHEQYDLLWMDVIDRTPAFCPEFGDPSWHMVTGSTELMGNWIDWVGNATDISHINYVHDFADESNGSVDEFKVDETCDSVMCTAFVRPKAAHPLTQHMQVKRSPIESEFHFPNTTIIRIKLKEPYEFITYTTVTPINRFETKMTWCFAHNINLGDPMMMRMLNNHFRYQMNKTIREDEAIIAELPHDFVPKINVQCDMFQMKVLSRLESMVRDDGDNLFLSI